MPRLDGLIDEWVRTLGEAEPALKPHLDEIADHLRTDVQARVNAGADLTDAFAAAIGAFGAPRELAQEFLKSERRREERIALRLTAMYLVASFLVTAAIVGIDKLVVPLNPTWFGLLLVFVVNPLLMLPFLARFLKTRRRSPTFS